MTPRILALVSFLYSALLVAGSPVQRPAVVPPAPPAVRPTTPADTERLGPHRYRLGAITVDSERRELRVPAEVNDVMTIEFAANTRNGAKAYESLLTVDSNAITFNAALLLLGLDPARAKKPTRQFDPATPGGDPVAIAVEWQQAGKTKRVPVEELLLDRRTGRTVEDGPWVYTGSTFIDTGNERGFLAEIDGVLLGLMRGPAALIENPRDDVVDGFGHIVLNPKAGAPPGTRVTLIVTALPRPSGR
ncbi:MAG: YdjY domain-containing protein [Acidobacteriota bacterium]